jgi:hypothetical protein
LLGFIASGRFDAFNIDVPEPGSREKTRQRFGTRQRSPSRRRILRVIGVIARRAAHFV